MNAQTSAPNHDGVGKMGTRIVLPFQIVEKLNKAYKTVVSDIEQQAVQDSNPWEGENTWSEFGKVSADCLEWISRLKYREAEPQLRLLCLWVEET